MQVIIYVMNNMKLLEEKLREAACVGDQETLESLLYRGVDVNSKNDVNGWTALHWAAYRNNVEAVSILLRNGADKTSLTHKGEMPSDLFVSEKIQQLFGTKNLTKIKPSLPIVPNYLKNPPLCCSSSTTNEAKLNQEVVCQKKDEKSLVLKLRLAESSESDFIEIELSKSELSFECFKNICCKELNINPSRVLKIRKLPDVIVRNNNDVLRLQDFQELEVVYKKEDE